MYSNEICKKTGISKDTLRYYVNLKILKPKKDKKNGYFIYDEKDLETLLFILKAKNLGFSLNEIYEIENKLSKTKCPHQSLLPFLQKKLKNVQEKIEDLKTIEKYFKKIIIDFKKRNCEKQTSDFKL